MLWQMLSDAFRGPFAARQAHARASARQPSVRQGIMALQQATPSIVADEDDDSPIFLLSAGWRSGSTMLQRLLMSDPGVLIWGEPYDECGLVQALAGTARAFRQGWPPKDYFYDGRPTGELTGEWIANLFPALEDWRRGQRALFDTMFAEPARRAGAARWGIKEVRLTTEHAAYLRWLYPNAKFLLLYRDPLEAYRSYCSFGRGWYDVFPDRPMLTPAAFGKHWRLLMEGFLRDAEALGAMLVKYEDLAAGSLALARIDSHMGIATDHAVLRRKVRGVEGTAARQSARVNRLERWLLAREVQPLARRLGYAC